MNDVLRAVLVGCGSISSAWLGAIAEIEEVEVVGFVDVNEDAAKQKAEQYRVADCAVSIDLKSVLDCVSPDMVFDCTVPEAHADVALEALRHGCHVLGEKPLADSMENAKRIIDASVQYGRYHAVIQNRRYDARIRRLRELIRSGRLGPITTINSDFFIGAHFGGFRDRMKHVLLLDMAIHTFNMARFIVGEDPVSVYCREWNPRGSWNDQDASAVAVFQMTNDVVYTYQGSWCAEGVNTT